MPEEIPPLAVIGVIRSCFVEKFGIPRQAGLAPAGVARLELSAGNGRPEMLRGLAAYSHIWLIYRFHEAVAEGWQATVRPPRLGGRKRLGVLATRSPHRPNHLGLSAVRLLDIIRDHDQAVLLLGGVDLLDGTPVLDIKPYLPYADRIEGATAPPFVTESTCRFVRFSSSATSFCVAYEKRTNRSLRSLIEDVLSQDPRPASQRSRRVRFAMTLWDVNVEWRVDEDRFVVDQCRLID